MILTINLENVPQDLNINQLLALIKIYFYLNKQDFNYDAKEYLDDLAKLGYLLLTYNDKGDITYIKITTEGLKALKQSYSLVDELTSVSPKPIGDSLVNKLSQEIIELFPKGKKDGKWPFRSSSTVISQRLKLFSSKYKINLSDRYDDIIKATESYVKSFENDKNGMSLLKYFIDKQQSGSLLLDYLEQLDDIEDGDIIGDTNINL